jgi:hypothetical protein
MKECYDCTFSVQNILDTRHKFGTYGHREKSAEVGRPFLGSVDDHLLHLQAQLLLQIVLAVDAITLCKARTIYVHTESNQSITLTGLRSHQIIFAIN